MLAFTLKSNGRIDRILTDVEVWPAFDPDDPPDPLPASVTARALWDTGATGSVVGARLVKELALTPVGKGPVRHGGGEDERHRYIVNLRLPNRVGVQGVLVSDQPDAPDFQVILGMDVIALGDFTITNAGGITWVTFRIPSSARTDYVVEADAKTYARVGRNQPCPCGSSKKFKVCCKPGLDRDRREAGLAPL